MKRSLFTAIVWLIGCLRDGLAARKGVAWSHRNQNAGKQPAPRI
jgi:hypothetical protein